MDIKKIHKKIIKHFRDNIKKVKYTSSREYKSLTLITEDHEVSIFSKNGNYSDSYMDYNKKPIKLGGNIIYSMFNEIETFRQKSKLPDNLGDNEDFMDFVEGLK